MVDVAGLARRGRRVDDAVLVREDGDQPPVARVEVEVALAGVVEVRLLEHERHPEQALPEADRRLPVGADERDVVHALALDLAHDRRLSRRDGRSPASTRAASAGSALPPESTSTVGPSGTTAPLSTAASGRAPVGSTKSFASSASVRIACEHGGFRHGHDLVHERRDDREGELAERLRADAVADRPRHVGRGPAHDPALAQATAAHRPPAPARRRRRAPRGGAP